MQTVLPQAAKAPGPVLALLASGQVVMRKVDGWKLATDRVPIGPFTPPSDTEIVTAPGIASHEFHDLRYRT